MKTLDFEAQRESLWKRVIRRRDIVLATSAGNKVTARAVYCVSDGAAVYFITSRAYTKFKQLEKNPNAALCFENVQLEGAAEFLGHPRTDENKTVLARCENVNDEFMAFAKYKNSVLIKISLTTAEMWVGNGREYIDFTEKKSWRVG